MIDTITTDMENHAAKNIYKTTSGILSELRNVNVNLVDRLEGPNGTGITLQMSEDIDHLIRKGEFPFTLEKHLEGYFGESTGSANVTSLRLERDMNIREVLETLEATGQLDKALEIVELYRQDGDPKPETILAYALAQYAKGWLAEELVASQDWFSKGSVSQDAGGIDGYAHGDASQIGSITRWNSKKAQIESSDIRHLLYQWDGDGNLTVGDPEDMLEENKRIASDAGLSATLIRRTAGNLKVNREVGRSFRYLWW